MVLKTKTVYLSSLILFLLVAAGGICRKAAVSSSQEAILAGVSGSAAAFDLDSHWTPRRGRAPAILGSQDSFRLGVLTMDLALAERRKDRRAVLLLAGRIRTALASAAVPELKSLLASIIDSDHQTRADRIAILQEMFAGSFWAFDTSQYGLGYWCRLAWEILSGSREDLIPGLLEGSNFPAVDGTAAQLQTEISQLIRARKLAAARTAVERAIERSGVPD